MKNKLLALVLMISISGFYGCEKCRTCTVVYENNYDSAERKCKGYANSFPDEYVTTIEIPDEICGDTPNPSIISSETFCEGVTGVSRIRYVCK